METYIGFSSMLFSLAGSLLDFQTLQANSSRSKFFRIPTFPVARLHIGEMGVLHIRSKNQKSACSWLYAIFRPVRLKFFI